MAIPIALQLYSVRDEASKDLFSILRQVADMGYDGVEFAGYYGHQAQAIREALDGVGLKAEGTHTGLSELSDEKIGETIDIHHTLGADYVIIPWLPEAMRNTSDACKATAERLTMISDKLRNHGLRCGFHAHEGDMHPMEGGQSAWYVLAEHTPADFIMQYDTANGMSGGADPVRPILALPGRSTSVHLKEFGDAAIGEGPIPWAEVFEACETVGGTQWYVVEHEAGSGPEALAAVDKCVKNLRGMGK